MQKTWLFLSVTISYCIWPLLPSLIWLSQLQLRALQNHILFRPQTNQSCQLMVRVHQFVVTISIFCGCWMRTRRNWRNIRKSRNGWKMNKAVENWNFISVRRKLVWAWKNGSVSVQNNIVFKVLHEKQKLSTCFPPSKFLILGAPKSFSSLPNFRAIELIWVEPSAIKPIDCCARPC